MDNKTRKMAVIIIVIVQMLFFVGWYAVESDVFEKPIGTIMVKTEPFDPRDLLRGQYIRLNYGFGNVRGRWDKDLKRTVYDDWASGLNLNDYKYNRKKKEVWVVLHEVYGFYEPKSASYEMPENVPSGDVVIRGIKRYRGINYGIERYFVPEGTREPRRSDTTVELNVYKKGRVRINKVFVEGKQWP